MKMSIIPDLNQIPPDQWDRLAGPDRNPFLRHAFLAGLETHGCVGEHWGWTPCHIVIHQDEELIAALPLYRKTNSYGELVFDWAWADAYQRAGGRYYPKLVSAIPYTPVTTPRLLVAPGHDTTTLRRQLIEYAIELTRTERLSSLHILFPSADEEARADTLHPDLLRRHDTQFHWRNRDYRDFDDFLDALNARRRKQIRRERRRVEESDVERRVVHGHEASAQDWQDIHRFYHTTFDKRGGHPTLTLPFFRHLGEQLGDRVVLLFARAKDRNIAGAFCIRSDDTLYGRHWGCEEEYHSLHFELCYYQGIDYCIRHRLARFEPGAQGEHKVWRGFEPSQVQSLHWLADPGFSEVIRRFLDRERIAVAEYRQEMTEHLPFRHDD